ncbi:MAG: biotin/lipoyl-binding protein [Eubacterium sp.]|nr:biotin/lipoyl-binding protein [Eubacterium sp.]
MKNYRITVNGNTYDVTVEEGAAGSAPAPAPAVKPAAPAPAPAAPAPAPAAKPAATGAAGSVTIASPMPGKILSVKASVGSSVKKGEVLMILEAMKMENEIVASEDGTVASINVGVGDSVEAGDTLATLN